MAKCLLKTVLISLGIMVALNAAGQQLINGGFESWEENDGILNPTGWTTNNFIGSHSQYITVKPTKDACNGNYSISISSTGPAFEGPGPGYAYQEVLLDDMVSSATIHYSYDVFSLGPGTYAGILFTAIQVTDTGTFAAAYKQKTYNEMTTECQIANSFLESDIPFNKIKITLSAHPFYGDLGSEGLSIIRFDDFVISTNVSVPSVSMPRLDIILQPNPASNSLTLKTEALIQALSIIDINGQLIKNLNPGIRVIDMNDLSSGIYILRIATADGVYNKKVIKE